ncbi:PREDICTED: transcription initiation factor TFIID subunit 11-like [Rhagoletis zephyria]|uniref:transcription initiation factor TFIID subunit 11-like n=1 Tax=Rhagoletis zephyria TaxID=28612 RepID=UPI0008113F85|nr:PREDICTED: transcription initiation factor TFIID subunit 11-like [Rhagoletis zephyria]
MISGSQNGSSYCHPSSTTIGTDDQLQIDDNPSVAGEASLEKNSFKNKSENKNKSIKLTSQDEDDRQKMMFLVSHFSKEQLERYEVFRRSKFSKNLIRKVIKDTLNLTISERFAVALAGIAKVYVGQIVEAGLDFMEEKNETGPLKPKHIREAERRIKRLTDYALKYPF